MVVGSRDLTAIFFGFIFISINKTNMLYKKVLFARTFRLDRIKLHSVLNTLFLNLPTSINNDEIKSLAIKPIFADRIRDRSKTFELRTYPPGILPGSWVALYESAPTKAIQTIFKAGRTFRLTPNDAWEMYSEEFGIDFDSYFGYFRRRAWAYGVEVKDVRSFEPISLSELRTSGDFNVPQMCQRLKSTHKRILTAAAA